MVVGSYFGSDFPLHLSAAIFLNLSDGRKTSQDCSFWSETFVVVIPPANNFAMAMKSLVLKTNVSPSKKNGKTGQELSNNENNDPAEFLPYKE